MNLSKDVKSVYQGFVRDERVSLKVEKAFFSVRIIKSL